MSEVRQQALIEAPPREVWALITDVERHTEWWPDIIEVECEGLEKGCDYRAVQEMPVGNVERQFLVEELEDCERFRINCVNTGTYVDFTLTEARGETFVDATAGMEPAKFRYRVFDTIAGKRYFTEWLEKSLASLRELARSRRESDGRPPSPDRAPRRGQSPVR